MSRQSKKRPSKARKRMYLSDQQFCKQLFKTFANALLYSVQKTLDDAKHGIYNNKPLPPLQDGDSFFKR